MSNRSQHPRLIELLAPARNAEVALAAISHGADAVYIGAEGFGARASAGNSLDDIARVVDAAHPFHVRVYVTVNTLVHDSELRQVEQLIHRLYRIGVDALIVQDMGILRMDIPPIALHASTQCDIRTPAKARFLQEAGFSQLVLPRELSLDEIRAMRKAVDIPLETFIHGALCVSYSGDCQASLLTTGRSANRGECAQICRLPYDLHCGGRTEPLVRGKYLLSLRDLSRQGRVADLLEAGVSSLKIEGRLKDASYVKNIVALYRREIDGIIRSAPDRYRRQSAGDVSLRFTPAATKSFNRGFTPYFLSLPAKGIPVAMASTDTPKSQGEPIGTVIKSTRDGRIIEARLDQQLSNGDGLSFFAPDGSFTGFRLNRAEGNKLYPATPVNPRPGTLLYRTSDKAFDDQLSGNSATRTMALDMVLRVSPAGIPVLDVVDSGRALNVSVMDTQADSTLDEARSPQAEQHSRTLGKLGGTIYTLRRLDDRADKIFIPASRLASLRRTALGALDSAAKATYPFDMRRDENRQSTYPHAILTRHDNVANRLAADFYRSHGVSAIEPAAESVMPKEKNPVVMTTRYCLRRELGACLRTPDGGKLKGPLTLRNGKYTFMLEFDCPNCQMKVKKL